MPIWVVMIRYDGEMSCTTHLTEKGCALAAIEDVMDYLQVHADEPDTHKTAYASSEDEEKLPVDWEVINRLDSKNLWALFRNYVEYTWDHYEYEIDCIKTKVRG